MRRRSAHSPASPYRALAHHPPNGPVPDSVALIRSFNVESNPTRPVRPSPLTASTIPDMPLDVLERMRSFPLFKSAPEEFLVAIGKHLRPQVHAAHDVILTEGDEAKAMYWLVRGVVAVTSRDGEAVYAELKPGSFFGEIGILMDMPRTATIVARTKCLLLILKKEHLNIEMPRFPEMETAIREEARERLTILNKKRQESGLTLKAATGSAPREAGPGKVFTGEVGAITEGTVVNQKKRKSPSPGAIEDPAAGSALGSGLVNVRQTLKELPLFSTLPPDILHFLGMSAQPKTYPPFTDIIRQGTAGNDIYFIVRGETEVIHDAAGQERERRVTRSTIRPRLKQGQYFGEVASLGLSLRRTATVRSITTVECLTISGEALNELWKSCPPNIKTQVEETARHRMTLEEGAETADVEMTDADAPPSISLNTAPQMTFTTPSKPSSPVKDELDQMEPKDPDPYLSVDMENIRNRRRGSLAPPNPTNDNASSLTTNGARLRMIDTSNSSKFAMPDTMSPDCEVPPKRAKIFPRRPHPSQKPALPDDVLATIFQHLDIVELLRLRQVSTHWRKLLATSPKLCTDVDLTPYNRKVSDDVIIKILAPFIGPRLQTIDLSNCFHITDEGFSTLWKVCGKNVKVWKMKSVWDVSANQILEMSDNAKDLEEVDWSNCRKVGDNLLARVVGWVVPEHANPTGTKQVIITSSAARLRGQKPHTQTVTLPPPGTVIGCPKLKRLDLSYCKHITDRSMAHLAAHASNRLESLCLTRCTSISDVGFQSWTPFRFNNLSRLCLADCTYLSDNAVVALVNAAKQLTHLDLSFCCALSDTATEVVALGLPFLRELRMAFCGSAVGDGSLASVGLHLHDLRRLSVRGCVRVTAAGVEAVLDGCAALEWADVSQCRNLEPWVRGGGVARWGYDEKAMPADAGAQATTLVVPPRGARNRRARKPVAFVVEKGPGGLR
ncbi:hypothetical protein DL766_000615 [Monosporascus sp. MC13-8B]|nr:hypothetical protein DL766_000615 [Monosporascus sp. MC13-8B]